MNEPAEYISPFARLVDCYKKYPIVFLLAFFFLAIVLRIIMLTNQGFEADISFWKSWGLAVYDHNVVWGIENTNNNYPTAFSYVLGAMTRVYSFFADPHNYYEYWSNNNLLFLTISKLPSAIADFGIAFIILFLGKWAGSKKKNKLGIPNLPFYWYVLIAGLYLINPISLIDGAWWGQVDSLGVFIYLAAFVLLIYKKPYAAGFVFMASMMTKLQNMIYGPVFFVLLWQVMGLPGLIKAIAGSITAFIGLNFEFFLARKMNLVFQQLTVNYDYFPFMSLNAYNFWWIVAGANGMYTLDKFTQIGLTNAKSMGLMMFSASYLFAVVIMVKETIYKMIKKGTKDIKLPDTQTLIYRFFTALVIVAGSFFLFQTESHDRYAFPISAYILLWATYFISASTTSLEKKDVLKTSIFAKFMLGYFLFTILYFFNLHNALIDNYPNNGINFLVGLNQDHITLAVSYLQLGLFGLFLIAVFKHVPRIFILVPIGAFILLLTANNMPLILKKPIPLTRFFPLVSEQDYGKRQKDMAVNSFQGIHYWNPLSVQYAFYKSGIGTHAKSYHQYHINKQFNRLTVDIGIDTEAGGDGSAVFEIYGDDRPLYISEPIGRYEMPRHVEVDIAGVELLGLVTNDAGDGINNDHTDWLNPLLWP